MATLLEKVPLSETASLAFMPVAVATLLPSESRGFDLYLRKGRTAEFVLFCERTQPLKGDAPLQLMDSGVLTLYVKFDHRQEYNRYLDEAMTGTRQVTADQRYQLLTAAAQSMLSEAFNKTSLLSSISTITNVARSIVGHLSSQHLVLRQLFSLMTHDYSTYTHANNVSTYCVVLARKLGISSTQDLTDIATGGLLHDAGKRHLPSKILNKVEPLVDNEKALIRRHPQLGFEDLCRSPELNWGQLMMVYQHHERLDGSGYPVRIEADEIHPWAKICAVADVFDALTGTRPYRRAMQPLEAVTFLSERAPARYDQEIVSCLSKLISINS